MRILHCHLIIKNMNDKQPPLSSYSSRKSPCVDICKYNKNNYCVGCKRHSDEITNWVNYSDSMRKAIMEDLASRNIDE
jgi:predicted Fe-S protein YdhL (DUF1289 family)